MGASVPLKSMKVTIALKLFALTFLDPVNSATSPVTVLLNIQPAIVVGRLDAFDRLSKQFAIPATGLSKVPLIIVGCVVLFTCNPSPSGYSKVKSVPEKVPVTSTLILLSASPKTFAFLSEVEVPVNVNVHATSKVGNVPNASSKDIVASFDAPAVAVSDPPAIISASNRVNL